MQQPWCARRLAERDDLPAWLKQGPAQVRFGREWLGQPERIEAWFDKYWTRHFEGVPLQVGAFRAADGTQTVIAVNATDTVQQATLRGHRKSKRVELQPSQVKLLPW